MKAWRIVWIALLITAVGVAWAGDRRTYDKSIETVWDEAVKATRDAELDLIDSDRSEHWFIAETPKKGLSGKASFEVRLERSGDHTNVVTRDVEGAGSNKIQKAQAAFFDALEKRMR